MMNKTQEYKAMLRIKTDPELQSMRSNLMARIKNHKAKNNPDESMLGNYQWQLSLVNNEFNRRKPKDRMSQAEGEAQYKLAVEPKERGLAEMTVDELKELWEKLKNILAKGLPQDQIQATKAQADAIEAEIKTRSDGAKEAKQEIAKISGEFWKDQSLWRDAGVGAVLFGSVGWAIGGRVWGWALVGAALGAGYNAVNK